MMVLETAKRADFDLFPLMPIKELATKSGANLAPELVEGVWRRRPEVICQPAGEEMLLYDPVADAVHVLNCTALAVWELCDGQHTTGDIVAYLRTHFAGTPGRNLIQDVQDVLHILEREYLIVQLNT